MPVRRPGRALAIKRCPGERARAGHCWLGHPYSSNDDLASAASRRRSSVWACLLIDVELQTGLIGECGVAEPLIRRIPDLLLQSPLARHFGPSAVTHLTFFPSAANGAAQ